MNEMPSPHSGRSWRDKWVERKGGLKGEKVCDREGKGRTTMKKVQWGRDNDKESRRGITKVGKKWVECLDKEWVKGIKKEWVEGLDNEG
ncbi:hypothetical protein VNO78_25662 [Psophocarpus tetragonolobus]|uniref:Uncharacterized protein n=1 Tax=Psophocarpus tetragonolobus TaxID=3891 RepID=A0AAN9XFL9_PSOTE